MLSPDLVTDPFHHLSWVRIQLSMSRCRSGIILGYLVGMSSCCNGLKSTILLIIDTGRSRLNRIEILQTILFTYSSLRAEKERRGV